MKITVLDGGIINPGDLQWTPITAIAETVLYDETSPEQIAERTADSDVVIVNRMALNAKSVADLGPQVKLVAVMATDAGLVNLPALEKRSIVVCNVRAYSAEEVAQHTMALVLEMYRHIGQHSQSVHEGEWLRRNTWCYWLEPPVSLDKKVIGLIGFGSTGRSVGRLAHAFGMGVLAFCRTPRNVPSYGPFSFVSLDTLLQKADIISLHCPLNAQTKNLICAKTISRMKDGAFLVNVSHGGLVNEDDCIAALNSGKLNGVATDVLRCEPPSEDDPFLSDARVLITPHMAWTSKTSRQRLIALTAENIRRWMQGTPVNLLTKTSKS